MYAVRRLRVVALCLVIVSPLILLLYNPKTVLELHPVNSIRFSVFPSGEIFGLGKNGSQCLPHEHVMFLKTHKCASTTVQNVLMRYGFKHNLTFALPRNGNGFGMPELFQAEMIPKKLLPPSGKIDIFPIHSRLNVPEHSKILHEDSRWVTIVRDPSRQYESLFIYYKLRESYGLNLTQFRDMPIEKLDALPRKDGIFGKNQMLFDLGYPDNMSVSQLRSALDRLDKLFDLVMISEFMDESLILLRHLLCWSLDDVVSFTMNARREEAKPPLDPELLSALRELNSADVLLYDHFLSKHRKAVLEFGLSKMADEVEELRALQNKYYKDCGTREVEVYSGLVNVYFASNKQEQKCVMMTLPELPLVNAARRHQRALLESLKPSTIRPSSKSNKGLASNRHTTENIP
ncbi:galactosylceramide sulfotransferase-like [Palaemon carinicauda]|uniref:galactosylceramide sulfotransferase-like n=1 Tax=Palaemon carinicauda TaxID=392227 RepID=UPI0035B616EE